MTSYFHGRPGPEFEQEVPLEHYLLAWLDAMLAEYGPCGGGGACPCADAFAEASLALLALGVLR